MLERKRASKRFGSLGGDEEAGPGDEGIELGSNLGEQESGITREHETTNIDDELDNWDENAADDWDDEEPAATTDGKTSSAPAVDEVAKGKRDD